MKSINTHRLITLFLCIKNCDSHINLKINEAILNISDLHLVNAPNKACTGAGTLRVLSQTQSTPTLLARNKFEK
jgi:hypothetical protein